MIGFDEAVALIVEAARPIGTEAVPIDAASGRLLAAPVLARIDGPRSDVSTMDGYAVRSADLPATIPVIGAAYPGAPFAGVLDPGSCVRIFTGAPLPQGADRVVMQEEVLRDGDQASFNEALSSSDFIRRKGSDFATGDALVEAGTLLTPRALVAAAAADADRLEVFRRPQVAIICTGDELAAPGQAALSPSAVPDSLSAGLSAFVAECGASVIGVERLGDDLAQLKRAATDALAAADIVVVTGGASVGERDFAKLMFDGLDLIFSKVAIKPGKPVWLGRAAGRLVFGLPGNPTSALVTARLLLRPLLAGLAGHDPMDSLAWRRMKLAAPLGAGGDRETFWRGRTTSDGVLVAANQDSGAQRTLAQSDLLVRQRRSTPALPAGAEVETLDL